MKTQFFGSALVITSSLKIEDVKTVAKYQPESLILWDKDEDGNKEPVFSVLYMKDCNGAINEQGAIFSKESPEGFAQITELVTVPADKDVKEFVADNYGKALLALQKFEDYFPAVIDELNETRAKIMDGVEVVG